MISFSEQPGICSVLIHVTEKCNLHCLNCFNRDVVVYDLQEIKKKLHLAERLHVQLVILSGGEPCELGTENLINYITSIKNGFDIRLDTNGTYPEVVEALLSNGLVEGVAVDIKIPIFKFVNNNEKITEDELYRYSMILFQRIKSPASIFWYSNNVYKTLTILQKYNLKYKLCRTVKYPFLTDQEVVCIRDWIESNFQIQWIELPYWRKL